MFARHSLALLALLLLCTILVTCDKSKPQPPKADTRDAIGNKYRNQNDILDKYSLDQLGEILQNRGNKALYENEPMDVRDISSSTIIDNMRFREKTIYTFDTRKDYYEIQDPEILKAANSVAGVVNVKYLRESSQGFTIKAPTMGARLGLCSGETYFSQPSAPDCTAFVVASDVVATAGHCTKFLGSSRIVFGFRALKTEANEVQFPTLIPKSQVYRPIQVLSYRDDGTGDFALVKVDRRIPDHPVLALHVSSAVAKGTIVYVLGHPGGLPLKLADNAFVTNVLGAGYFLSNLDTFGGNSGSPVFNAGTNEVEGILAKGGIDYKRDNGCDKALVCPAGPDGKKDCSGEAATLMSELSDALKLISAGNASVTSTTSDTSISSSPGDKSLGSGTLSSQVITEDHAAPYVTTFRSGKVLSGAGSAYSNEYTVISDPARSGFKIANFVYTLQGDRSCNAWSTCKSSIEGDRVVFRFTLQGHNEWPPPGQGESEGFLVVTYAPK